MDIPNKKGNLTVKGTPLTNDAEEQKIVVCLMIDDFSGVCLTTKREWDKIMDGLRECNPEEEITLGEEVFGKGISVRKLLKSLRVYDSPEHLKAFKLLFDNQKNIGVNIIEELSDALVVLRDEFNLP